MHAIYTRISSDPEGLRLGVERQREDCLSLASRLWPTSPTPRIYEDNDISAWSGKSRPEYERLCDDIARGVVDGLVIYNLDRLHRHPRELESFIDLCQKHALRDVHAVAGDVDLSTSDGQLMARVMGAVAKKESDDKSRRVKRAKQQLASQGRPPGGPRAFGYNTTMTELVPREADAIRRCIDDLLAGHSIAFAARHLDEIPKVKGGGTKWNRGNVHRLITSPRIAGLRAYRGEILGPGTWPAIITPAERDLLLTRFTRSEGTEHVRRRRTPSRHWLAGIVRCGVCGTSMTGSTAKGETYYQCAGRGCTTIVAHYAESLVREFVLTRLDDPRFAAHLHAPDDDRARAALDELEDAHRRYGELATDYAAGLIPAGTWASIRATLAQRVEELTKLAAPPSRPHEPHLARVAWRDATVQQRHLLARLFVARVDVAQATRGARMADRCTLVPTEDAGRPSEE